MTGVSFSNSSLSIVCTCCSPFPLSYTVYLSTMVLSLTAVHLNLGQGLCCQDYFPKFSFCIPQIPLRFTCMCGMIPYFCYLFNSFLAQQKIDWWCPRTSHQHNSHYHPKTLLLLIEIMETWLWAPISLCVGCLLSCEISHTLYGNGLAFSCSITHLIQK